MQDSRVKITKERDTKMKKITAVSMILLFLSGAALSATAVTEDISKIGMGARPIGMGRAYVSVANDVNSIFINPAGLGQINKWQFTSMYTSLFEGDLNYVVLGASSPFAFGKVGIGFVSTGSGQIISPSTSGMTFFDYYDRLLILSYAKSDPIMIGENRLSAGFNIKYFQKGFSDTVQNTGQGFDMDLGLKYMTPTGLSLGVNAMNFLPTSIVWSSGANDSIPATLKIGASNKYLDNKLMLSVDADIPAGRNVPTPLHAGCEYYANEYLTLRAGIDQSISAASALSTNLTAGVGLTLRKITFDYAYHPYSENGLSPAHFMSLSISQ